MKNFYIPTYQEAREIVEKTGELIFYEMKQVVDGYQISHFNYRLATYQDFITHKAKELRGLTFVFNQDGTVYRRYVLLHKFFNLNQVEETQHHLLKDTPFVAVHDKADGSIISFVQLPNGKVYAKSKMVVADNIQAQMAQAIYEKNPAVKRLVDYAMNNDLMPIFELVSPTNRVVLKYIETNLVLLRLRVNSTGEYLPLDALGEYLNGVEQVETETHLYQNWDDLLQLVDTVEDKEGWVVTLPHDMVKLKTKWYCDRHNLLTDFINREDYIIEMILDEKIDDVLGQLGQDEVEIRSLIDAVTKRVNDFMANTVAGTNKLVDEYYTTCNGDRKQFAALYHRNFHFDFALAVAQGRDAWNALDEKGKEMVELLINMYETGFKETANYVGDRKAFSAAYEKDPVYAPYFLAAHRVMKDREIFDHIKQDLKKRTYFLGNAREFIRTGIPPKSIR
jgi:T4 RnlA family RNA ligase